LFVLLMTVPVMDSAETNALSAATTEATAVRRRESKDMRITIQVYVKQKPMLGCCVQLFRVVPKLPSQR